MTSTTAANVAHIAAWEQTFNTDIERMVSDLYSPTCVFSGAPLSHEKLLRFEKRVLAAAPNRRLRVDRTHGVDDVVVAEGVLLDADQGDDWKLPFCAVLTFADGKIVSDNTYTDYSRWPGMR